MKQLTVLSLHEIEHTQGTVKLISDNPSLQRRKGYVLVPQPNLADENDPLRWSLAKRITVLLTLLFFTAMNNFAITGIAPGFKQIVEQFGSNNSQLSYLISLPSLGEGLGCFTIAPLAARIGKRPLWLFCATLFLVCEIWAAASKSYASLLVARFLASFSAGAVEPLSGDMVSDIFFLHERGFYFGLQTLFLTLGATTSPIFCGFLIQAKGWRWYHWLCAILAGFCVVTIFFLGPETHYKRDFHKAMDSTGAGQEAEADRLARHTSHTMKDETTETGVAQIDDLRHVETQASMGSYVARRTYMQDLKPWSVNNRDISLRGCLARPWILCAFPGMVYGVLSFSIHIAVFTVLLSLLPIYYSAPPYGFSTTSQGLLYLGPSIGAVAGFMAGGWLNDIVSHALTRRNGGVFEPEMRLLNMLVPGIITPVGLIMFGAGVTNHLHWIVPVIGDAFVCCGLAACGAVLQPYFLDSFLPVGTDAMIMFNGFKNFVGFGIGFAAVPWLEKDGLLAMFCILAALVFVIDGSGIFVYFYGKRMRAWFSRKKIFIF